MESNQDNPFEYISMPMHDHTFSRRASESDRWEEEVLKKTLATIVKLPALLLLLLLLSVLCVVIIIQFCYLWLLLL